MKNIIFLLLFVTLPAQAYLTAASSGGGPATTDDLSEGIANLYFLDARAKSACVADAIADGVTDVAPSQNAVYDALALKEPSISSGTSAQYYRGDKTMQTLNTAAVTEASNLYFTNTRAKDAMPVLGTLHVDKAGADSASCGSAGAPCLTIQKALDNIGNAASAADLKTPKTVLIGAGIYDEALTIPHGRILTLVAEGTVILGNGAGSNWASTNSRSITVTQNNADVFSSDVKPALNIMALPASDTTSTFIAEAGGFFISGNLNVAGDGLTNTLNLSSVKIAGNLVHTTAALTNWQAYRTIIAGTVTTTGNLVLERAYDCRFNGLVSVNAYNMVANSNFAAGMTVQSVQSNILPNGMFFTNFAGTFTGPANSLRLDATSNYYFTQNAAALGGSATKVMLGNAMVTSVSGSQPACNAANRGVMWNVDGGTGVADVYQICQKNSSDVYAWTTH